MLWKKKLRSRSYAHENQELCSRSHVNDKENLSSTKTISINWYWLEQQNSCKELRISMHIHNARISDKISMGRGQARSQGGRSPPKKFFAPPWKNVLNVVWNYWTQFKKFEPLSENPSPLLVSQAGYGPGRGVPRRGHNVPSNKSLGALKSPYNVAGTFFNTLHLLPKDLRFEHGGAELVSCPGRHLIPLHPFSWASERVPRPTST